MSSKMKWVFALVATVVVLAGAAVVYQLFSAQYTPELLEAQSSKSESTSSASRIKAPDFEAVGLDGNPVRLSALSGKPVVLNFGPANAGHAGRRCRTFRRPTKNMGIRSTLSW